MKNAINDMVEKARRARFLETDQLSLGQLITALEAIKIEPGENPWVYYDFGNFQPNHIDSWRGSYTELAVGFAEQDNDKNPRLKEFLNLLKAAVGNTYTGYKGGYFEMEEDTPIWADNYGCSSTTAIVGVIDDGYRVIIETRYMEF